ncbi:MAG: LysR family transcriptional regulator [Paracoccaceae bacterium]|jgi:DNA-binding transcriptional LysR family regulator|nr:LysR family transcriptional regulator [Paracoccaceae bacterium]
MVTPKDSDPMSVDFAALRVLRLVHDYGSFSRTAEVMGVNQSSVSYTIDRLRRAFGDPLFVRQGAGIVPTDRCDEIVRDAARMVDEFVALSAPRVFDPARAEATMILSCNYYERATLVPAMLRRLRAVAPGVKLRVITSTVRGREQLSRGECDILVGPVQIGDAGFFGRRVLTDHYVCVMAPDNPLGDAPLDVAGFAAAPQAVVTYGGNWRSRYLVEMEAAGLAPNMVLELPSPATLRDILPGTDLIATVPLRTALSFGPGLRIVDCPFPAPFEIDLYWTARTHHAPMHRWLRGLIAQVAAELEGAVIRS